jgi:hypothetical protein
MSKKIQSSIAMGRQCFQEAAGSHLPVLSFQRSDLVRKRGEKEFLS